MLRVEDFGLAGFPLGWWSVIGRCMLTRDFGFQR